MKNLLLAAFIFLMAGTFVSQAQQVVDNFDTSAADSVYMKINEGAPTRMDYTDDNVDFVEGTGSFKADIYVGAFHAWGSFAEIQHAAGDAGDGQYLDFTGYDSLSIWIKVYEPATAPANMVFRIQFRDQPTPTDPVEQYVYENAVTLDAATGWFNLRLSLGQVESDGSVNPNDQGFVITPSSWGLPKNNEILDYDKILSYGLTVVTTANAVDSVLVGFDNMEMFSPKSLPAIVFNGIAYGPQIVQPTWAWGQSTMEVEIGAGPLPNTNAIKWVQGNEWNNGWTGIGANVDPAFDLAVAWQQDSVQFKLKCEEGVGPLRMQFEGGGGKVGTVFTPTADNQWHDYKLALREMVYQDGTSGFDSSAVTVVGLMAEASGIAGKVIYITDWWTGNPEFDVIPPSPPLNVSAFGGDKQNIITWDDVPGETGERYDVYYSENPITDVANAEVVKFNIAENNQLASHLLLSPVADQSTTYYYAIVCKDASGNQSIVSNNSPAVTNTAKGVTTISLTAPTFVADGDLAEWQSITPFSMKISDGTGFIAPNTAIDSDADLSVLSWVAVDANYLYVAFDINDDVVVPSANSTSYQNDCPDLFLGLYNWHGAPHTSLKRGVEPDYHFRFAYNRVLLDGVAGADSIVGLGADYYWQEKFPSGYVVEFKISWADLAVPGNDAVFTPVEGYRIPIDYSINDNDTQTPGSERDGIMCYSFYNDDQSWGDVSRWSHTWIGALWNPVGVEYEEGQPVTEYALTQNYPNPFNPSTQIKFALKESGYVTLKVYDALGKEVATLIKGDYASGSYNVSFDASGLSSGIYFYRLETGSFVQTNKMMLLK